MSISLVLFALLSILVLIVGFSTRKKKGLIWLKLSWLAFLFAGTMSQSCIHRVALYDDRPYYYEHHVRIWRDGHDDHWHHHRGDRWEEEVR